MNFLPQDKLEGNHPNKVLQRTKMRCGFPLSTALIGEPAVLGTSRTGRIRHCNSHFGTLGTLE